MRQLLHPFGNTAALRGWTHALLASVTASLIGLPVAAAVALVWPGPVSG
jgi:hypothetical protein